MREKTGIYMILKIEIIIKKMKWDNIRIIMKKNEKMKNDKNIKINKLMIFFMLKKFFKKL